MGRANGCVPPNAGWGQWGFGSGRLGCRGRLGALENQDLLKGHAWPGLQGPLGLPPAHHQELH